MKKQFVEDHLGNRYNSETEMCDAYGVLYCTYKKRIKMGWQLKDALTIPVDERRRNIGKFFKDVAEDHLGNLYSSKSALCKAYNIRLNTFNKRIENGWPLKDALTYPVSERRKNNSVQVDHLGREYASKTEICKAWGISVYTYNKREKLGWPIEKILTEPVINDDYKRSKIGNKKCMNNGLLCEIVDYAGDSFIVKFEDGTTIESKFYRYNRGLIQYPGLHRGRRGYFKNFKTIYICSFGEDKVLYKCECSKCGLREIYTPRQMIEHEAICSADK